MSREEQIVEAGKTAAEGKEFSVLVNKQRRTMSAYEIGFIEGAEWADSHPQWIPVEEKLPEEGGHYLVSDGTDSMVDIWLYGVGWSDPDNNNGRVTHWMPLPTPPAKKGGQDAR